MNTTDTMAGRGLAALRAAITGQVFVPGEVGYDQARRAWNLAVDERPAVVVEAGSAADVGHLLRLPPLPQLPEPLCGRAFINFEAAYRRELPAVRR